MRSGAGSALKNDALPYVISASGLSLVNTGDNDSEYHLYHGPWYDSMFWNKSTRQLLENGDEDCVLGFVKAFNSLKDQQYSLTDRNAFATSTTAQYRLKQIDNDGGVKYSRIITLVSTNAVTDAVFANPFTGTLKIQLNLTQPQTVSIKMYDMQGRVVAVQNPLQYSASANTINVSGSANLKPGAYLLQINTATEHKVYKVIKQ